MKLLPFPQIEYHQKEKVEIIGERKKKEKVNQKKWVISLSFLLKDRTKFNHFFDMIIIFGVAACKVDPN